MEFPLFDLPAEALERVLGFVSSKADRKALRLTCQRSRTLVDSSLPAGKRAYAALLARCSPPAPGRSAPEVEKALMSFALDGNAASVTTGRLDGFDRFWLHCRAQQLGLKSASGPDVGNDLGREFAHWKNVTLTKPGGWNLPDAPHAFEVRSRGPRQSARAYRQSRMADWTTACEECGAELDAWQALYHYSGMGPLCDDCVEADPELSPLKWEAKAEFFR